jgi:hypothetical protein
LFPRSFVYDSFLFGYFFGPILLPDFLTLGFLCPGLRLYGRLWFDRVAVYRHFEDPFFFAAFFNGFMSFLGLPFFGRVKSFNTSVGIIQNLTLPNCCNCAPGTRPSRSHAATVGYGVLIFSANSVAVIKPTVSILQK